MFRASTLYIKICSLLSVMAENKYNAHAVILKDRKAYEEKIFLFLNLEMFCFTMRNTALGKSKVTGLTSYEE